MELTREHFRAIIFHNFRRGLSRQECIDELKSLYGDEAPSYSTVKNWFNEFNRGRRSLKDEDREGRPKTAVVPENIDAVRELIMQDRHVTYREIEASLGISSTSIHSILHGHLAVKKVCSRWIPHNLTVAQKKARVDWCKEILKKYNRGVSKDVYKIVTGDESWIYAYEPETKQNKKNEKETKDAVEAFKNHVLEVSQSEWKKCFDNWFERMQKCINLAGEYFEKQ